MKHHRVPLFHYFHPIKIVGNYSFGFSKLIIELIRNDEWWILIVATLFFPSSNNFFYFLVCKIEHSNDQRHNVIKSFFSEEAVLYSPDIDRLSFGWIEDTGGPRIVRILGHQGIVLLQKSY